jgi:hypothetical protein
MHSTAREEQQHTCDEFEELVVGKVGQASQGLRFRAHQCDIVVDVQPRRCPHQEQLMKRALVRTQQE